MIAEAKSHVVIDDPGKFQQLYDLPPDINMVVCIGGRGGMKTYEVSKFAAFSSTIKKKRCVVLRDEKELIRESILNDILNRYDAANKYGHLSQTTDKLENGIKDKETGEMLLFTKGFRGSESNRTSNLKGASNIDIAIVEEAEDIRDVNKFNTFHDSLRKEGVLVIVILNTPDLHHWIIKRYFNLEQAYDQNGQKLDGYYEIIPKKIKGFLCIKTSYLDNKYLPSHVVDRYKSYGDPESPNYNLHYFLTAILGLCSSGRKGQILTKVKPIKLAEYLALPFKEYYGQDFGTSNPAGFVGVKFDKNNSWCRQINYLPMDTLSIAKNYCKLRLDTTRDKIVADSAEPKTIERLQNGWKRDELTAEDLVAYPNLLKGFFVVPAIKGPGSIKTGIGLMTSMNLYAVEESADLWNEIYNWIYDVDKNEQSTDEPVDDFNHLIDPWRYVITEYKGPTNKLQTGYFR